MGAPKAQSPWTIPEPLRKVSAAVPPTAANCRAVIPCHNEGRSIAAVVTAVRAWLSVVVVDDGSDDATAAEAGRAGAVVLSHAESRGKGGALRTGWTHCGQAGAEWVLLLDGDGQHAAEDIPVLLAAAVDPVKLVLGNRMGRAHAMPWMRRWANRWLSARISALAGVEIPDSQCGFRLVHLPTLLGLSVRAERFEVESELCVAFARAGHPIVSVPVQCRYAGERSRISPGRDYWRWWRWYCAARRSLHQ